MVRQRLWHEICSFALLQRGRRLKPMLPSGRCDGTLSTDYFASGTRPAGFFENLWDDYATPDGTCIRDYVQVEDLIAAHILALEYLKAGNPSDAFNLGSNDGYSVKEMLEAARAVTGKEIPAEVVPRRAGDPAQLVAASEKARSILGWKPAYTDIKDIIRTAWNWHVSHPHGYED